MALRDLVMGGAGCSVPGAGPSTSNPLSGLAEALGSNAKTQERLRELPAALRPLDGPGHSHSLGPSLRLPGFEEAGGAAFPDAAAAEFMHAFQGRQDHERAFEGAWGEAMHMPRGGEAAHFADFENIYRELPPPMGMPGEGLLGAPERVLAGFLHSFVASSRGGAPFQAVPLPELGLSAGDKRRIRDRSSIMARHFLADQPPEMVQAQVSALLQSLGIDPMSVPGGPPPPSALMGGRFAEFEDFWKAGAPGGAEAARGGQWAAEFEASMPHPGPSGAWAEEFAQGPGAQWAEELAADMRVRNSRTADATAATSASIAEVLQQDPDPRFQNSKFLQFVSKMSRGELVLEDNAVREQAVSANAWAEDFERHHQHMREGPEHWGEEFAAERQQAAAGPRDWADEFAAKMGDLGIEDDAADPSAGGWLDSYNRFVEEQVAGEAGSSAPPAYAFSAVNPYVGHAAPLRKGQELFREGLLSEAVLALEAAVLREAGNAHAWRLLGAAQAENDDDRQAIAAMVQARDADPTNLDVLLALGVSHTNELEQAEALGYVKSWLGTHPRFQELSARAAAAMSHAEVTALFEQAALVAPDDADVHTVLGVLYNLSRDYDRAIAAFEQALARRPNDYSLWNKLGATQANSAHSADAIQAYQQALDLKPNYVRAWANMGIGYANQGRYEDSVRYYVRALAMNPKAENAWQYLRISLSCIGETRAMEACDQKDIEWLQQKFPLQ